MKLTPRFQQKEPLRITEQTDLYNGNNWAFPRIMITRWKDITVFVPTPLEGGATIYSNGFFFVQTILADQYIHRGELRLESIKSLSSVEYE